MICAYRRQLLPAPQQTAFLFDHFVCDGEQPRRHIDAAQLAYGAPYIGEECKAVSGYAENCILAGALETGAWREWCKYLDFRTTRRAASHAVPIR
jgi:hypothetical protein